MLDAYFDAFEGFMRTGNTERLAGFINLETNPVVLNVYRNGYLKTCTDALAASYPVVCSLLGEDYFRRLARAYVEANPPTSGTLVGYGSHFAEFLRSRSDEHGLAYLSDAAAIDAAWLVSYFAKDVVALAPADGSPVLATTMTRSELMPLVMKVFEPLMTYSSPSRSARVPRLARSEPASGSENSWHQNSSPEKIFGRTRSCCSGVPASRIVGAAQPIPITFAGRPIPAASNSSSMMIC